MSPDAAVSIVYPCLAHAFERQILFVTFDSTPGGTSQGNTISGLGLEKAGISQHDRRHLLIKLV